MECSPLLNIICTEYDKNMQTKCELQKAFQIRSIRCMMRTFATKKAKKAFQIMSIRLMITVLLNKRANMNLSMEVSFNAIGSPIYKRISDPRQTLQFEIQPVTLLHIS